MARLINESGVLSEAQKINLDDTKNLGAALSDVGFAKMIEAIHKVQDEMGITGTTAKEASGTISGSVASMKAAWSDFLTSLADADADYQWQLDNLLESVKTVAGNIAPIAEQALWSIMNMVEQVLPEIAEKVPEFISEFLPQVTGIAVQLMQTLMNGIIENQGVLFASLFSVVTYLVETFVSMLPQIIQLGFSLLVSLANGIAQSLPTLIPTIMSVIMEIVGILTDPANLSALLTAALAIMVELSYGLMDAIPQLVNACIMIIEGLTDFLTRPENIGKLLLAAAQIVIALGTGIVKAIPQIQLFTRELSRKVIENFKNADWGQIGIDLVAGFKSGILRAWSNLKKWFKELFGDLIGIAKKILGIASPSKVFKKLGGFTAEGFGIGFDDEFESVRNDMEDAMDFTSPDSSFGGYVSTMSGYSGGGYGGTSIGNITINVSGANYSDEQSLAEAIALEIQNMTERRSAVYA